MNRDARHFVFWSKLRKRPRPCSPASAAQLYFSGNRAELIFLLVSCFAFITCKTLSPPVYPLTVALPLHLGAPMGSFDLNLCIQERKDQLCKICTCCYSKITKYLHYNARNLQKKVRGDYSPTCCYLLLYFFAVTQKGMVEKREEKMWKPCRTSEAPALMVVVLIFFWTEMQYEKDACWLEARSYDRNRCAV